MEKEYTELVEFLGEKFDNIDKKFDKVEENFHNIDKKFDKVDENFYNIETKLTTLEEKLDGKTDKSDVESLKTSLDAYAKKADTYFEEMVSLSHKVDRHEKWFHIVADKLGVKLEY